LAIASVAIAKTVAGNPYRQNGLLIQNQTGNNATFTRSDIGNISNVNLNGTSAARSYSDVHELTSIGGQTQIFDADGNLVTRNGGATLTWDDAGRLESVTDSGTTSFGYDASGKRATKSDGTTTTVYIYAGPNCIAEYGSGTAAASPDVQFVYAQGIDSLVLVDDGTNELAVLRNQQWSVTALVNNSTGSVAERYSYDHFGKRTIYAANGTTVRTVSSHKNPFGYTSRRHDDETELMYYRARYYDPATGEFISQDPLEYVDGMSQYRGYFAPGGVDSEGQNWTPIAKPTVDWKKIYTWYERRESTFWVDNYFGPGQHEVTRWITEKNQSDFKILTKTLRVTDVGIAGPSKPKSPSTPFGKPDSATLITLYRTSTSWKLPKDNILKQNKGNIAGAACRKKYAAEQTCCRKMDTEQFELKTFYDEFYVIGTMKKNSGFGGGYYCDCQKEFQRLLPLVKARNICGKLERLPKSYIGIGTDGKNDDNWQVAPNQF
jgi:RHS repeat-associated protein